MRKNDSQKERSGPIPFQAVQREDIPKTRRGKHMQVITLLLSYLDQLSPGAALKVPLDSLPDTKANIRAALNRATRRTGTAIATSSDSGNLYIWKTNGKS